MSLLPDGPFAAPEVLHAHQQALWQAQRRHVMERSAFYRDLWMGAAPPEDLRDLPALPLSDKSQLRVSQAAQPPFGNYLAAPRAQAVRLHRTSGTTGQAMNLALSARDCQPLVRFRTGDIIAVDETAPCTCGRTGFRFRVVGRSDDMVVVRGLNMFPTMVAAVIGRFAELSGDYRIVLPGPPPYDVLPVQVELAPGETAGPGLAARIEAAVKTQLGATARVTLLLPGSLPLTEGKTRRVIRSDR